MRKIILCLTFFATINGYTQTNYQLPAKEILELADVKIPPITIVSRNNKYMLFAERSLYKSLEELAEPELKLGGLRINPKNFNTSRSTFYTSLKLQLLNPSNTITITGLPDPLKAQYIQFSPTETHIAFVQADQEQLSLWLIEISTGIARKLVDGTMNATFGMPYSWNNNGTQILYKFKGDRKMLESTVVLPSGPATQDAKGEKSAARTYQDLLKNEQDVKLFNYYTKAALYTIDIRDNVVAMLLSDAVYTLYNYSPDGKFILTETLKEPYSYSLPCYLFATDISVYDISGNLVSLFYQRAADERKTTSFDAVPPGKRRISWRNDKPATLYWCEAPDEGDPNNQSEYRDVLFQSDFPFTEVKLICKLKNRLSTIAWGDDNIAIIKDFWWKNRNVKTYLINPSANNEIITLSDKSRDDLYANSGDFQTTDNAFNKAVLLFNSNKTKLYLVGEGYSPQGNKPFIDEFDIALRTTKRLWQADGKSTYERITRIVDVESGLLLTNIQSPKVYPNTYLRNIKSNKLIQLTFNQNPYLALEKVSKQKIYYTRNDGVQLSATLYLPAGYDKKKDGRLPLLMDAYPTEYKDEKAAGQVKESPYMFMNIGWYSALFWVTRGYAVLEDAQFPIIGKNNTEPNDSYIEQLVENARAAIGAVDSMGIVDKNKCAVMGHSYGAFMTANLLAHSNLFSAGLARSGAYNRTLTPFGFQAEERTYWEAQEVYLKMSPFNYANKIKTPILLVHGDADNNPGTFTLQSERLFQAIKGNGGTSRLVLLPYESHSYAGRENVLHMLWEMDTWLNQHVKNRK